LSQSAFVNKLGRDVLSKPGSLALFLLPPLLGLERDPQGLDFNETQTLAAVWECLGIGIGAIGFFPTIPFTPASWRASTVAT
jgi:hypothetical protein